MLEVTGGDGRTQRDCARCHPAVRAPWRGRSLFCSVRFTANTGLNAWAVQGARGGLRQSRRPGGRKPPLLRPPARAQRGSQGLAVGRGRAARAPQPYADMGTPPRAPVPSCCGDSPCDHRRPGVAHGPALPCVGVRPESLGPAPAEAGLSPGASHWCPVPAAGPWPGQEGPAQGIDRCPQCQD